MLKKNILQIIIIVLLATILTVVMVKFPQLGFNQQDSNEQVLLGLIGASLAGDMYFGYVSIGALADGFGKNVYSSKQMSDFMKGIDTFLNNMVKVYDEALKNYKFGKEDKKFIDESIKAMRLLQNMTKALNKYSSNKDNKYLKDFGDFRTKAWDKISVILGFK